MQKLPGASNDNLPGQYLLRSQEYAELARTTRSLKKSTRYSEIAKACADLAQEGAGERLTPGGDER